MIKKIVNRFYVMVSVIKMLLKIRSEIGYRTAVFNYSVCLFSEFYYTHPQNISKVLLASLSVAIKNQSIVRFIIPVKYDKEFVLRLIYAVFIKVLFFKAVRLSFINSNIRINRECVIKFRNKEYMKEYYDLIYDQLSRENCKGSIDTIHDDVVYNTLNWCVGQLKKYNVLLAKFEPILILSHHRTYFRTGYIWRAAGIYNKPILYFGPSGDRTKIIYTRNYKDLYSIHLIPKRTGNVNIDNLDASRNRILERYKGNDSDDKYKSVGSNKIAYDSSRLKEMLGLDNRKKTITIFSHVLIDDPHCGAWQAFESYEDWLAYMCKLALELPDFNWLIKLHPDNSNYKADKLEQDIINDAVLRGCVKVIPADVSPISVYDITDLACTLRGTVGIEYTVLGKPAIHAGEPLYENFKKLLIAKTDAEYRELISNHAIHEVTEFDSKLAAEFIEEYPSQFYYSPIWAECTDAWWEPRFKNQAYVADSITKKIVSSELLKLSDTLNDAMAKTNG